MAEVREVQFLVERPCGDADTSVFRQRYPEGFPVWVKWPSPRIHKCGGRVFEMTASSQILLYRAGMGFKDDPFAVAELVCEHMGHLIE